MDYWLQVIYNLYIVKEGTFKLCFFVFERALLFTGSPTTKQNIISSESSLSALSCLECPNNSLHVTATFLGKRASSRAYDYVSSFAFQDALGSVNTLTVIAWTITPRTVSARVKLNLQQSSLWDNVDSCHEEEGSSDFNTYTLRHLVSQHLPLHYFIHKGLIADTISMLQTLQIIPHLILSILVR